MDSTRDVFAKSLPKWLTSTRHVAVCREAVATPRMGSTTNQDHEAALC